MYGLASHEIINDKVVETVITRVYERGDAGWMIRIIKPFSEVEI